MVANLRNPILFSFNDFLNPRNHLNLLFSDVLCAIETNSTAPRG